MIHSLKYSNLVLRLCIAAVFIWFGVDKFINPEYWLNAWLPATILNFLTSVHIAGTGFIYALAVFELVVAISLVMDIFTSTFSILATFYLLIGVVMNGFSQIVVRDVGIIGGLLALSFWPGRRF